MPTPSFHSKSKPIRRHTRRTLAELAVLGLLGLVVYAPLLNAPYLYDDHKLIPRSEAVFSATDDATAPSGLLQQVRILLKQPRPLRQLTHVLDRKLFGDSPTAAHAVNVLLHILVAWLGLRLLQELGHAEDVARLASALFLLLPICVESVAVVTHRKEMLAALFLLTGLRLALRGGFAANAGTGLCFVLAMAGKETAIVFPILFLVVTMAPGSADAPVRGRLDPKRWRTLITLFVLALLVGVGSWLQVRFSMEASGVSFANLNRDRPGHLTSAASWSEVLNISTWALARYLTMLVSPWGHVLRPTPPLEEGASTVGFAMAWLVATVFFGAIVTAWRRKNPLCRPLLWVAVALSPVLFPPLLRSGATAIYADRYAYLAAFGYAWLIASAIGLLRRKGHALASMTIGLSLLIIQGIGAHVHARHFSSENALWTHVISRNPGDFLVQYNLAYAKWKEVGDRDAARLHFGRMAEQNPEFIFGLCAYAEFHASEGEKDEAFRILEKSLKRNPEAPQLYRQRGLYKLLEGDDDGAAADFEQTLRLGGGDAILHHNYALAQERQAKWREAARSYARAARHPVFRRDAERIPLLTRETASPRTQGPDARTLVVSIEDVPAGDSAVNSDAQHVAARLNALGKVEGHREIPFEGVAIFGESLDALAETALDVLNRHTPIANCVILSTNGGVSGEGEETQRLRRIARFVLLCRMNGIRPILVAPPPAPGQATAGAQDRESGPTHFQERLLAFSREAAVLFLDPCGQLKSPAQDNGNALSPDASLTAAQIESISALVSRFLLSESLVLPFPSQSKHP